MNLKDIIKKNNFNPNDFFFYGNDIAKVNNLPNFSKKGKLILVTSTSPTKHGEGKTTLAISLNDALNSLNYQSAVVLREPSLGPVFGMKGGATGGGLAKVVPENEINLHFTGDFHALTTANNLLSAIIDNHIYQGNELNIDPKTIAHERCLDLNDRSLRNIMVNDQETRFNITPASELMAILCLSQDKEDLKTRLGNILIGYTYDKNPVYAKDLQCQNALIILLEQAIKPNVVQTLEHNIAFIHGGPFANIAHGTNSIISTKYCLNNFNYTLIETGFGSDMGALKYYDIITRTNENLIPDVVVLNTTIAGLKHHGNGNLNEGISNLEYHISNLKKYTKNLLVVLNKHTDDLDSDITFIKNYVEKENILFSLSEGYLKGSVGSTDAAKKIVELSKTSPIKIDYSYELTDDLQTKIEKFCQANYGASNIIYTEKAREKLKLLDNFKNLPICVAKTQYSITDNEKILGFPKYFTMTVKDIKVFNGAGFITIYFGNILTMPGLGPNANYLYM